MKVLVTGGAGFIGSHYVRSAAGRRVPRAGRRRRGRARQAHVRRQPGEPRAGAGLAAVSVRAGRHLRRRSRRRAAWRRSTRWCTSRPSRTSTVRSKVRPTSSSRTWWAPRRCWTARCGTASRSSCTCRPTRCTARSTTAPGPRTSRCCRTRRTRPARRHPTCWPAPTTAPTDCRSTSPGAPTTTGPYQFPEKVIPLFVTNLMDGEQVPLYGDGLNVRDWLHVDDHCRGIELVRDERPAGRDLQHRRRHRADQPRADRAARRRVR